MPVKKTDNSPLHIDALKRGRLKLRIIGESPLYYNAMSLKARRELLIGGKRKTAADKVKIKHNPEQEFKDSIYKMKDGKTLLGFPAPAIKGAMATAAIETPGITKSSINRLVFIPTEKIAVYGKPYMKMDIVKSAGINQTPDIRTRAFLPNWCAEIDIAFVMPTLTAHSIISLLSNAGTICGIGDFRQEKGKGSYGCFSVHGEDMGEYKDIWDDITNQGRAVQQRGMDNPECYDEETEELYDLLVEERELREAA